MTPIVADPADIVSDAETREEVETWLGRFETEGNCSRSYTAKRNLVRELVAWQQEEPETRREVAKAVIRNLQDRMYLGEILRNWL